MRRICRTSSGDLLGHLQACLLFLCDDNPFVGNREPFSVAQHQLRDGPVAICLHTVNGCAMSERVGGPVVPLVGLVVGIERDEERVVPLVGRRQVGDADQLS